MSRLIVVSNRVPDPDRAPSGGLAVALKSALTERGGVWMGWSGKSCDDSETPGFTTHQAGKIIYALTDLAERDFTEYYQGFANSVLWPLCHYRLDLTDYARRDMAAYFRVNRLFAQRLQPLLDAGDVIWVHDYHHLPLAGELRRLELGNRIGFFMHIPWPSPEVFLTLPVAEQLLREMASYDLIGFQTPADAGNFALCLQRSGLAQPVLGRPECYRMGAREFRIGAFPISIDVDEIARAATQSARSPRIRRLRDTLLGQKLVVGVDRLDYSKGIPQRLTGYRRFLEDNPAWHGQVSFLQITPKSREGVKEYDALQREVAEMAGEIAGCYGHLDWSPVRYVNHAFNQSILAGVFRMSQAALVTPLRDGMNLVAKEYVAAQDREDPGVLILSRFAGAAEELGDGALLINPYDTDSIAAALTRAFSMPLAERRMRHQAMFAQLSGSTVYHWCAAFLKCLTAGSHRTSSGHICSDIEPAIQETGRSSASVF